MKTFTILILAILISFISTDDTKYCGLTTASSAKDCHDLTVQTGYKYCCYVDGKDKDGNESKGCMPVTEENYKNIKDYIDSLKKLSTGGKINKFDCNSNYLRISLISLLLFLL